VESSCELADGRWPLPSNQFQSGQTSRRTVALSVRPHISYTKFVGTSQFGITGLY
jgi:hypothetical protein